jgi:hypothetical protein
MRDTRAAADPNYSVPPDDLFGDFPLLSRWMASIGLIFSLSLEKYWRTTSAAICSANRSKDFQFTWHFLRRNIGHQLRQVSVFPVQFHANYSTTGHTTFGRQLFLEKTQVLERCAAIVVT